MDSRRHFSYGSAQQRVGLFEYAVSGDSAGMGDPCDQWIMATCFFPYMFFVVIPMFRRLDVMSIYEYVERRFGQGMRTFTACLFVGWRLSWMASAFYVPCLALITTASRHG